MRAAQLCGPCHRRVGDDHPVEAGLERRLRDFRALGPREIGRDLEQQRRRIGRRHQGAGGFERRDQGEQARLPLEVPQPRRIGRGHVDDEIVCERAHRLDARDVICDRVGALLVLAEIGADQARAPAPGREPCAHGLEALVVEAEPVDERAILGQTEQSRLGIAGLRARRDGAGLDEAEAEPQHGVGHLGILVEAGSEPDRIRELPSPERDPEARRIRLGHVRRDPRAKRLDARAMRRLRRQQAQQRQCQVEDSSHEA